MKIVLQDGIKDCGVCSLLSVVKYYGGDVSREYLREITNTTKNGVTAYNLIDGAKKLGFCAEGVCGDMTKIDDNNLPCLAHLSINSKYKHFVVIYKIDKNNKKMFIMDPAKGKRIMSFSEFKLQTTNNYIFLRPMKKLPYFINKKVIRKTIKNIILTKKKLVFLLIFLIFIYFIFNILAAFHFKYLLEFVVYYKNTTNIITICVVVVFLYLIKLISGLLKNILFSKLSSIIDECITIKTFRQILLLPYLYYKNRTTGEVISRLRDLTTVKKFLIESFSILITDFVSLILFFIFLIKINFKLSCITLFFIVGLLFFTILINVRRRKIYSLVCKGEEKCNSYLIEALNNADTIKGGHIEKRLIDKFFLLYRNLLEKSYSFSVVLWISNFIKESMKDILLLIIYGVGSVLIVNNKFNIGDIFLFQSFLMCFLSSFLNVVGFVDDYCDYKISLSRVEDLYNITNECFDGSYYYYGYDLRGDITFKNLIYKYGSKKILLGINLTIKKGEKILLIGDSGSGKSSLMKILMRYLEVPYGMCSINDIDINHYHLENIRKNISYVSSNEFLFTDTLYNNITLGKEISEAEFSDIVEITGLEKILKSQVSDYHMMIEENGFNFSSGERQRIIISRYLLRKSNIYIFDEAFGQLDVDNESDILRKMFKYLKDQTIIVISHRTNNKKQFDRLLRLKDGLIYEESL